MHLLSSLQAVAHGSDSVQYFQWRKGRGGSEKLHGAVIGQEALYRGKHVMLGPSLNIQRTPCAGETSSTWVKIPTWRREWR
jgi:hypothetical protein